MNIVVSGGMAGSVQSGRRQEVREVGSNLHQVRIGDLHDWQC